MSPLEKRKIKTAKVKAEVAEAKAEAKAKAEVAEAMEIVCSYFKTGLF